MDSKNHHFMLHNRQKYSTSNASSLTSALAYVCSVVVAILCYLWSYKCEFGGNIYFSNLEMFLLSLYINVELYINIFLVNNQENVSWLIVRK